MLKVLQESSEESFSPLDEIIEEGARRMLATALHAEVTAYIEAHAQDVDENDRRLVVRNGHHQSREVVTGAGAVKVRQPRVNYKRIDPVTGEYKRFASAILPAWARKSANVEAVLPLLYLHGMSGNDFAPALEQFLGAKAGLSPAVITGLTRQGAGPRQCVQRPLPGRYRLRVCVGRRPALQGPPGAG